MGSEDVVHTSIIFLIISFVENRQPWSFKKSIVIDKKVTSWDLFHDPAPVRWLGHIELEMIVSMCWFGFYLKC